MVGCWWWLRCCLCDCRRKPYQFPHLFQAFQPRDSKYTIRIPSHNTQSLVFSRAHQQCCFKELPVFCLLFFLLLGLPSLWKQYQTSNGWYAGSVSARHKRPEVIWWVKNILLNFHLNYISSLLRETWNVFY